MSAQEVIQRLEDLGLKGMAAAARESGAVADDFYEKLGPMLDREIQMRELHRWAKRLRDAGLSKAPPSPDEVSCDAGRGLLRQTLVEVAECDWIERRETVVITGAAGSGKSFVATAIAFGALQRGRRPYYARTARLLSDLSAARSGGAYQRNLARLAKHDLLVLDDFLTTQLDPREVRDLLEILEERPETGATLIASPHPPHQFVALLGAGPAAEAIGQRLVVPATHIHLRGAHIRPKKKVSPANEQRQLLLPVV